MSTAPSQSLRAQLDILHGDYVDDINRAVADDQDRRVAELASAYDRDATEMVARYENMTHLLPITRPAAKRPSFLKRIFTR